MRSILWISLMAGWLMVGCAPALAPLPMNPPAPSAHPIVPAAIPMAVPTASNVLPDETSTPEVTPVPAGPQAPAINNTVWLNTEPLTQDQLNGHVVLIDFWTFG